MPTHHILCERDANTHNSNQELKTKDFLRAHHQPLLSYRVFGLNNQNKDNRRKFVSFQLACGDPILMHLPEISIIDSQDQTLNSIFDLLLEIADSPHVLLSQGIMCTTEYYSLIHSFQIEELINYRSIGLRLRQLKTESSFTIQSGVTKADTVTAQRSLCSWRKHALSHASRDYQKGNLVHCHFSDRLGMETKHNSSEVSYTHQMNQRQGCSRSQRFSPSFLPTGLYTLSLERSGKYTTSYRIELPYWAPGMVWTAPSFCQATCTTVHFPDGIPGAQRGQESCLPIVLKSADVGDWSMLNYKDQQLSLTGLLRWQVQKAGSADRDGYCFIGLLEKGSKQVPDPSPMLISWKQCQGEWSVTTDSTACIRAWLDTRHGFRRWGCGVETGIGKRREGVNMPIIGHP